MDDLLLTIKTFKAHIVVFLIFANTHSATSSDLLCALFLQGHQHCECPQRDWLLTITKQSHMQDFIIGGELVHVCSVSGLDMLRSVGYYCKYAAYTRSARSACSSGGATLKLLTVCVSQTAGATNQKVEAAGLHKSMYCVSDTGLGEQCRCQITKVTLCNWRCRCEVRPHQWLWRSLNMWNTKCHFNCTISFAWITRLTCSFLNVLAGDSSTINPTYYWRDICFDTLFHFAAHQHLCRLLEPFSAACAVFLLL